MKKIFFVSLCILFVFQLAGQTEKGMWLLGGQVFSSNSFSTDKRTKTENHIHYINSEVGYFLTKKHLVGTKLFFHFRDRKMINSASQQFDKSLEFNSALSGFYRFYPLADKRLGFFGEMQFSILGASQNVNTFYNQFRAQVGFGGYFFLRKDLAFEMNFAKPFYQTSGLSDIPKIVTNFSIIRNFKSNTKTQLPRLEDSYLFVRNFYYGLGFQREIPISARSLRSGTNFSVNTGFFLGSRWLIDLQYSVRDFASLTRSHIFIDLQLESAFFIRLNEKGTYLRPSTTFRFENQGRIPSNNPDLRGFRKLGYIGKLELTQFLGDQTIIGGGANIVWTTFGPAVAHFRINAALRLSYFINENFAVEYKGNFYLNDRLINRTDNDVILNLTNVNAEVKIRHFFFQK